MGRWLRSAEVNKNLIIVLVILAVGAGGFWVYKWRSGAAERAEFQAEPDRVWELWCPECKKSFTFKGTEWKNVAKEGDKLQCPDCKKFVCKWGPPPADTTGAIAP